MASELTKKRHVCTVTWKSSNRFTITVAVGPTPTITTVDITFTSFEFNTVRDKIKGNQDIMDLNLCDDAILMMSCLVFIINYEKSQSSPPVPPVTSIVCTWGGMDTANIDVRVDKTDRGDYVFNVVYYRATDTVNVNVTVQHMKNVSDLRVPNIVTLVDTALKKTIPPPVRLSMIGMVYCLCYIDLTTKPGPPLRVFKGFSIQHQN